MYIYHLNMKRYYNNDNIHLDPVRSSWNHQTLDFHQPINKVNRNRNQLENDIIIQELSPKLLPKNDNHELVPSNNYSNKMNLTSFNNEITRYKNMSQEIIDKDEELQKYKNKIYQLELTLTETEKEKNTAVSSEIENKLLKVKLNEQYGLSRELTEVKHKLKREKLENKKILETNQKLKKIIHKQHLRLTNKEYNSESESDDYESDESDYSSEEDDDEKKKQLSFEQAKKIYKNDNLKKLLLKYTKGLPVKKLETIFINMKITPKTKITKELLTIVINRLKRK